METFLQIFSGSGYYWGLFAFLVVGGLCTPIPEDVALLTAGYLVYSGAIHWWPTLAVCYVGLLIGDALLYWIGAHFGQKIVAHRWFVRVIPPERLARIRHNFQRWGHLSIMFARFLFGLRSPTFIVSGVMHIRLRSFLFYDGIGGLLSIPLFIGLGMFFGSNLDALTHDVRRIEHWITLGALTAISFGTGIWWLRRRRTQRLAAHAASNHHSSNEHITTPDISATGSED